MSTTKQIPITERQRFWQFRFFCKPTPKHPRFMELERVHVFVWLFDESEELAKLRAVNLVSLFPLDYQDKVIGLDLTEIVDKPSELTPWQVDQFSKAYDLGVNCFLEELKGDEESHLWPQPDNIG